MQEAEYGMTDMAMNNSRYHGDETLLVRFYTHPRNNITKSQEMGRPIFEDTIYIEIMQPGNKDSIIQRPATQRDKQRFAEHYRRFEARITEEQVEGTLLSEWPQVTRAQVEELRFLNIRTVEQLAAVSDSNSQGIMGVQMLKAKAKKFLESADKEATAEKFADLEAKNAELAAKLEELMADKPTRRRKTTKAAEPEAAVEE